MEKIIKSNCRGCHGGCGVLVHVEDGRITKIEGSPDFPTNHGVMCSRGLSFLQLVYHPDRVTHPLRRTGKRGEGKWEQISWDEALDTIAEKYKKIITEYGAESIALGYGTGRNYEGFLYRFSNLLGTPNVLTSGHMCYGPRVATSGIINGKLTLCDYENNPKCVVVWGNNVVISNGDEYTGENLTKALAQGTKLIVVDPRLTYLAGRADVWLQLRPGTDVALAMGMANVIVEEKLYDKNFVEKYVYGWDEFTTRIKEYNLEKVEEITWVPADKIREAARLYATTKPAGIQWGCAIEQNINCTDSVRALVSLMAITGNLDVPGGNISPESPPWLPVSQFAMHRELPAEQRAKRLGGDTYKLADRIAVITPKVVWDAILTGKPYPIKAVQIHGSNPVITRSNAAEVYRALSKLEFFVVADFFLTPTAELADIFLPAATWLEMEDIGDYWKRQNYIYPRTKIIQVGECRSDHEMFLELGKKLGQKDQWFDTVEGNLDYILKPMGLTWQEFRRLDYYRVSQKYRKYKTEGFRTPTGKVELYSTIMEKWGYDPLPIY
ncbi:MAG: molybdopterin-dependent oxidoreductase, partial [Candidatus Omnitrophica bacterium]|nr:molybdopterin-dependent oxidoreductase [Candidatus Omnitrophota bacterium]